jgi:hypothetical protein
VGTAARRCGAAWHAAWLLALLGACLASRAGRRRSEGASYAFRALQDWTFFPRGVGGWVCSTRQSYLGPQCTRACVTEIQDREICPFFRSVRAKFPYFSQKHRGNPVGQGRPPTTPVRQIGHISNLRPTLWGKCPIQAAAGGAAAAAARRRYRTIRRSPRVNLHAFCYS